MSNNNLVSCSKIGVDCVANDPVDINCGGPKYLGFDFYVKEEQTEEMKKFIIVTLESLEVPLENIYVSGKDVLSEDKVWTKERIVNSIKDDAHYLQSEAKIRCKSSFRR